MSKQTYRVVDRSLLLPAYKRWVIEPTVRFVPAKVSPNAITHLGHLASLGAMGSAVAAPWLGDWAFALSAVLLQLYCWADNADGAHARRTKQSSEWGEVLDHGLDQLTSIYVGLIAASMLGLGPMGWVICPALASFAAAHTYWEQTRTGVMQLGIANQVEAMLLTGLALVGTSAFGPSLWDVTFAGVALQKALLYWVVIAVSVGAARSAWRVFRQTDARTCATGVLPALSIAAVLVAGALGVVASEATALAASTAGAYWGLHMLAVRFGRPDAASYALFGSCGACFVGLVFCDRGLARVPPASGWACAVAFTAIFAVAIAIDLGAVRARLRAKREP